MSFMQQQGRTSHLQQLWLQFFGDPSKWWDNRFKKKKSNYPDFRHKVSGEVLWVDGWSNPSWVKEKLLTAQSGLDISGREKFAEELWQQFFSDPSKWWDHRSDKRDARFPDFKNKITQEALWIEGKWTPQWVKDELTAITPGRLQKSTFSWNTKIEKYVKDGENVKALQSFHEMQRDNVIPDKITYIRVLKACGNLALLEEGRSVHSQVIQSGIEVDVFVSNCLLHMYAKCSRMQDACRVFNSMPRRDVISWNAMIHGHVKCLESDKALQLYKLMQQEGVEADPITFVGVLDSCACLMALEEGQSVHAQIIRSGLDRDIYIGTSLIGMYAKCGRIKAAWRVFNHMPAHNVVSWSALIVGSAKCGQEEKAIEFFHLMQKEQVKPDNVTFVGVLTACASLKAQEAGRDAHLQAIQSGYEKDMIVGNCLIDMYAKCGSLLEAWKVFKNMKCRNIASWSSMIMGCVNCGEANDALELFEQMQEKGIEPNSVTFVGVLNACARTACLDQGRRVHSQIIQSRYEINMQVRNALIDMYSKCGSIEDAFREFRNMPKRDIVSWTAILGGCARHGLGKEALNLFSQMCQNTLQIDSTAFVCLLSACSHAGLMDEGFYYFGSITPVYGLSRTRKHYSCLIDLLCRST